MEDNKDKDQVNQVLTLLITGGIAGISGYFIGKEKYTAWDEFIKKFNERLNHLAYFKVIIPAKSLNSTRMWQIYREGINGYLFGLPNASVPMIFKCLEIGLKSKHSEVEGKTADLMKPYALIEWAESYLKDRKDIAHGFRILRNIQHKETIIKEQDALECICHISEILNIVYPFASVNFQGNCAFCKSSYVVKIMKNDDYIGNVLPISCNSCEQVNSVRIL